jgi:hypothetical protein
MPIRIWQNDADPSGSGFPKTELFCPEIGSDSHIGLLESKIQGYY